MNIEICITCSHWKSNNKKVGLTAKKPRWLIAAYWILVYKYCSDLENDIAIIFSMPENPEVVVLHDL